MVRNFNYETMTLRNEIALLVKSQMAMKEDLEALRAAYVSEEEMVICMHVDVPLHYSQTHTHALTTDRL